MKTMTLHIPNSVALDERQTTRFLAAKLYESGQLTLSQAADLASLSKVAFSEILADYDVSLFNYPASEIAKMPLSYNIIIAGTSCFILMDKIDELDLLKRLFGEVTTTNEIAKEFGKALPEW